MPPDLKARGSAKRHRVARTSRSRRVALAGLALALAALIAAPRLSTFLSSAALVTRAAGIRGPWTDRLAAWRARPVVAEDLTFATRSGPVAARLYRPDGRVRRSLVLSAGVNPRGLDEPRLAAFGHAIAERGIAVITPALPDLLDFRITPRLTDQIEDVARAVAGRSDLAPDGHVGLVGISFSGGLSIVAAGRPALRDDVAFVVSLGGHGDLPRTVRFLSTSILPDGSRGAAHDYGLAVTLHNVVPGLVPPDQVEPLRHGLRTFLLASTVYMSDQGEGRRMYDESVRLEGTLPEPARTLLHHANTRNVAALGPLVEPRLPEFTADAALSPERSPAPLAPTYLLHGTDDAVVPAMETELLARSLTRRGTPVRVLITPLVSHADVTKSPAPLDVLRLVGFWGGVVGR